MLGAVIVPGAALTELALTAGRHVGSPVVEELVLESPLLLPEGTAVQLQVTVAEAGPDGRRAVAVYTRPQPGPDEDGPPETTCHARGTLALGTAPLASPFPAAWPPPGARAVPVEALYARLADIGYDYGPVFQGVRAAWQDGEHVYAEVALADDHAATAQRFGIHPALLDAALHGPARAGRPKPAPGPGHPGGRGHAADRPRRTARRVRGQRGSAGVPPGQAGSAGPGRAAVERLAVPGRLEPGPGRVPRRNGPAARGEPR